MPKNAKFLVWKYIKALEFKKTKTFLKECIKHKKNYIEGLNSKNKNKNKNTEGGGFP